VPLKGNPKLERFFLLVGSFMLILGFLYWAKPVLIPLAIAVLLTFIIAPLVSLMQRWGLHRVPAVLSVVVAVFILLGGIFSIFFMQFKSLAEDLPRYQIQIEEKITKLREASNDSWISKVLDFSNTVNKIASEEGQNEARKNEPVSVKMESSVLSFAQSIASQVLEFLINAVLIFILVVFMSVRREDLRNRVIRLWGHHNLTSTTRVLDDASQRISRFLLFQVIFNIGFGVVLAIGLTIIGIPYAYIWGFFATLLRYVPYIGPWIAALFPLLVSLVMPGWTPFFLVLAYFAVLELLHSNVVEPLAFGHSIGVSGVALLVAALVWTWLWGPLGLVLSTPLTACLLVFGRHVPGLEFLSLLLGDEPAMQKSTIFYQRLLAKDPEEAEDLVENYLNDHPVEQAYPDILFPALLLAKKDREGNDLAAEDHAFVLAATRDVFHDVVMPAYSNNQPPQSNEKTIPTRTVILGIPGQDDTDALAVEMFKEAVNPGCFEYVSISPTFFKDREMSAISDESSPLFLLLTLSSQKRMRTRVLCKKIRDLYPHAKILVGCWGLENDREMVREKLTAFGADGVGFTFSETREMLNSANASASPTPTKGVESGTPALQQGNCHV
jgi:predicted PurR-regulated permease PerM